MTDLRTWDAWHNVHQPYEIDWWRVAIANGHSGHDRAFERHWQPVKDWIKPKGMILDIGPGPRPPFAPCKAIEPLAGKYQMMVPLRWWADVQVWERPAEELIQEAVGSFDTIICWNCLDHAVGWREILANMRNYCKGTAKVALATDIHAAYPGHPGFELEELARELDKHFTITDRREKFKHDLALMMVPK